MFAYAISPSALSHLVFVPELVRQGDLWRLVTWPIATDPAIWAVISLAFFWIFGHRIEELVGRGRFLAVGGDHDASHSSSHSSGRSRAASTTCWCSG